MANMKLKSAHCAVSGNVVYVTQGLCPNKICPSSTVSIDQRHQIMRKNMVNIAQLRFNILFLFYILHIHEDNARTEQGNWFVCITILCTVCPGNTQDRTALPWSAPSCAFYGLWCTVFSLFTWHKVCWWSRSRNANLFQCPPYIRRPAPAHLPHSQ